MEERTFSTPQALAQWHIDHWHTNEDDDYEEVGDTRCPWCNTRIFRLYHEAACPVRPLIEQYRRQGLQSLRAFLDALPYGLEGFEKRLSTLKIEHRRVFHPENGYYVRFDLGLNTWTAEFYENGCFKQLAWT